MYFFFFSSRRRHTRSPRDWSSDVCSSDLDRKAGVHALVGRSVAHRRDSLAGVHRAGALAVSLERGLVLPDREDGELVGLADALHHLTAEIAVLFTGRLPVALEERYAFRRGRG